MPTVDQSGSKVVIGGWIRIEYGHQGVYWIGGAYHSILSKVVLKRTPKTRAAASRRRLFADQRPRLRGRGSQ